MQTNMEFRYKCADNISVSANSRIGTPPRPTPRHYKRPSINAIHRGKARSPQKPFMVENGSKTLYIALDMSRVTIYNGTVVGRGEETIL